MDEVMMRHWRASLLLVLCLLQVVTKTGYAILEQESQQVSVFGIVDLK